MGTSSDSNPGHIGGRRVQSPPMWSSTYPYFITVSHAHFLANLSYRIVWNSLLSWVLLIYIFLRLANSRWPPGCLCIGDPIHLRSRSAVSMLGIFAGEFFDSPDALFAFLIVLCSLVSFSWYLKFHLVIEMCLPTWAHSSENFYFIPMTISWTLRPWVSKRAVILKNLSVEVAAWLWDLCAGFSNWFQSWRMEASAFNFVPFSAVCFFIFLLFSSYSNFDWYIVFTSTEE